MTLPKIVWAHLHPPDGTALWPCRCHPVPPELCSISAPEEMLNLLQDQQQRRGARPGVRMKATAPSMVWNQQGRRQRDVPSLPHPSGADIPQGDVGCCCRSCLGASRGGRSRVRSAAVLEQPRGARPGPGAPVEPSNGSLITRHHGGMEALPTAANPRAVTTETTLTLHRLQRVLCVCLCVLLHLPPPLVVFCVRVRKKELGFFLFPGKHLAPGLRSCEKQDQGRWMDR